MNIRIDSVTVNGLGPITSIRWQLKNINLIYGRNEQGKTFLVEFLLRSLFKNASNTRPLTDSGQVNVSGLDREVISFTPKSKMKIDDYLFSVDDEKPVDLSRLCVVKGGETSFIPYNKDSISKAVLKEYLSDQRTLDAIVKDIPATIQESAWENGQIIPRRNMGLLKEWNESSQRLNNIDERLQELDESFALGEVKKLKGELGALSKIVEGQLLARRAYAHKIAEQIKDRENAIGKIPADKLEEVKSLIIKLTEKCEVIEKSKSEIDILEPECEHFDWLGKAIEECERRPAAFADKQGLIFFILSILGVAATIVFAFIRTPIASLIAGLVSILFVVLAFIQYRSKLSEIGDDIEVNRIFQEFEEKFGEKGRSIAALKSKFNSLSKNYYSLQKLIEQMDGHQQDKEDLEKKIPYLLTQLKKENIEPKDFSEVISALQIEHEELTKEIGELKQALAATQVRPDEYLSEIIETTYDPDILNRDQGTKLELEHRLEDIQGKLEILKQRVCDITSDPISSEWDELIDHLRDKRDDECKKAKELKARIGSGIIISQVIANLREREDESITHALVSPNMKEPLQAITHNYDGVELEGNDLIAYNKTQRFLVSALSTGAQEQVLLALRIGIASHVLTERRMFLILDDAFQHSDWERRVWLVDEMASLANMGWQIIYFSMDDHIKQLFEERIQPVFMDQYQTFIMQSQS